MPLCIPDDVRALDINGTDFPDPPYTDAVLQGYIDMAECLLPDDCDSCTASKAACSLAAHFALVFKTGGGGAAAGGPVTAEAAGGLSRSYGNVMLGDADDFLRKTSYGQMFLIYRDAIPCQYVPLVLC